MNFHQVLSNNFPRLNSALYSLYFAEWTKWGFDASIARVIFITEAIALFL